MLRFAWTSDVQLRQHSLKLFSWRTSRTLDDVIASFERDALQESLGWAVYLAQIEPVNQYARDVAKASDPAPELLPEVEQALSIRTPRLL